MKRYVPRGELNTSDPQRIDRYRPGSRRRTVDDLSHVETSTLTTSSVVPQLRGSMKCAIAIDQAAAVGARSTICRTVERLFKQAT